MRARRARPPLGCRSHNHRGPSMRARRARPPLGCRSSRRRPLRRHARGDPTTGHGPAASGGAAPAKRGGRTGAGLGLGPAARARAPGRGLGARGEGRGGGAQATWATSRFDQAKPNVKKGTVTSTNQACDDRTITRRSTTFNQLRHGPGAHQSPANPWKSNSYVQDSPSPQGPDPATDGQQMVNPNRADRGEATPRPGAETVRGRFRPPTVMPKAAADETSPPRTTAAIARKTVAIARTTSAIATRPKGKRKKGGRKKTRGREKRRKVARTRKKGLAVRKIEERSRTRTTSLAGSTPIRGFSFSLPIGTAMMTKPARRDVAEGSATSAAQGEGSHGFGRGGKRVANAAPTLPSRTRPPNK